MDRVFTSKQRPHNDIQVMAIGVGLNDHGGRHVGIFHRDAKAGAVFFLHLAFHLECRNESPDPSYISYLSIDPLVHRRRLPHIAAKFRLVWNANGKFVPYGLSDASDFFDPVTGKYLLGPTRYGLTCSSFVVAGFRLAGFRLLNEPTLPPMRPGDAEWKQSMTALLRKVKASDEHIKRFEDDNPFLRLRPEDVAAASLIAPLPAAFEQIAPVSVEILKLLGVTPPPQPVPPVITTPPSSS